MPNRLASFDPRKLAYLEKENYVAYYQKNWARLLRVSIALVRDTFDLTWWQAARGAYLVARAEIAFAPFPENDIAQAQDFMLRFYELIKRIHALQIDPTRLAQLELRWWSAHRILFGNAENRELVDALADLYANAYGLDPAKVQSAASLRAQGMLYSDLWVNAGKPASSPLLIQEEQALYESYAALKDLLVEQAS